MDAVQLEILKACLTLGTHILGAAFLCLLAWLLTNKWEVQRKETEIALLADSRKKQKQHELKLLATNRFYALYGEFCAVWKYLDALNKGEYELKERESQRVKLLEISSTVEGEMESVFVRLAHEYDLTKADIRVIGSFRQAFQCLRKAIGRNQPHIWKDLPLSAEYRAFKRLACAVAGILSRDPVSPGTMNSHERFNAITSKEWENFGVEFSD